MSETLGSPSPGHLGFGPPGRGFVAIEAFYISAQTRTLVALASFGGGLLLAIALPIVPLWTGTSVAVFSLSLAATIGLGKTTTACGLNVLSYLGGPAAPRPVRLRDAILYAMASTLTAATIGLLVGVLGTFLEMSALWPGLAVILVVLGLMELSLVRAPFVVSRRWQVPVEWVRGRRLAPVIWGVLLGSGLTTWMPFASFFGLVIVSAVAPVPAGAGLMATYGLGRSLPAFGVVRVGPRLVDLLTGRFWHLRLLAHSVSGCLTLALAGAIIGVSR